MKYSGYTWSFAVAVILLTITALVSFREISALSAPQSDDATARWPDDTLAIAAAAAAAAPTYEDLVASDATWRRENARQYTLAELRVRGDGRRSARQQMQDRVYAFTRAGNRGAAIAELERWVESHPNDSDALLWSARLLNEAGRSKDSVKRYRQALALAGSR